MNKVIFFGKSLIDLVFFYFSKLIPKTKNRWVFGSWFGDRFTDNSKWLYIYALKHLSNIEVIWITKSEDDYKKIKAFGGKVYLYNSFKALYFILTAKVVFMTQSFKDLASYNLIGGALKVQLWHGVALKKIGFDSYGSNEEKGFLKRINSKLVHFLRTYDLYISPSLIYKEVVKTAFRVPNSKILDVGQPRNDIFFYNNLKCQFRNQVNENIQKFYGINISKKKIITYMPTFRDTKGLSFSFKNLNDNQQKQIDELLENSNSIIIEKTHFIDGMMREKNMSNGLKNIIALSDIDSQELLVSTDVLITDYSSCYFDYLLADRPIIHYTYDYDYYKNKDRGMYYELTDVCGGMICYTYDEMLGALKEYLNDKKKDYNLREEIRKRFMTFEYGKSCESIIRSVINLIDKDKKIN